jgi:D-tyrosyl-tRNA(Tyr) deacylase
MGQNMVILKRCGMRVVLQRVKQGSVTVAGNKIAEIGKGLVLLVGIGHGDGESQASFLAEKAANLRIFEDEAGKMNLSVKDVGGAAIVVSQFTLYADARKGRRPSFTDAALPDVAKPLVDRFTQLLANQGVPVQTGEFGADMQVEILNDGPVTILLEA